MKSIAFPRSALILLTFAALVPAAPATAQDTPTRDQANAALKKAVAFFDGKVSIEGAYLWRYSEDLSLREGEEKATAIPRRVLRNGAVADDDRSVREDAATGKPRDIPRYRAVHDRRLRRE